MAGEAEFQKYSRGCVYRLIHFYGDDAVNESDLYKELGTLTKDRERWETNIPYVSSLLAHDSVKIQAKALWLLGEMGLAYPLSVQDVVQDIASFCSSPVSLLRERAVNALGRIGPNTPDIYENYMSVFAGLLDDTDDKVRMEAPEIFRVLGKHRPEFVRPYLEQLQRMAETDQNRVVRIHCLGAIKAAERQTTRNLNSNQISDISPLSDLANLTELNLSSNHLDDISALSRLTNLKSLSLVSNQIIDIRPLSTLTNLTGLYMARNQIRDIRPLSGMTNLRYLSMFENHVGDVSPLSGLTNLTSLYLSTNQISDINSLSNLTKLDQLILNENRISDLMCTHIG